MKKSKRFKPVVRVAEAREKQAASALGEAQAHLQSQLARLEELQNYQIDYLQRLQATARQGITASRMQDFQRFLENLKVAIKQQETLVQIANRSLELKKQHWFENRGKLKSYDNVMERYITEENTQQNKREQIETDEHASRSGIKTRRY